MGFEKMYTATTQFASNCLSTGVSVLKVLLTSAYHVKLPKAQQNSCVILGNGPSLNQSLAKHMDVLKKHTLICVNGFALAKEYADLKPRYYVLLDPLLWRDDSEHIKKIITGIIEATTWEIELLVPQKAKNSATIKRIRQQNPKIKVIYFNYTVFKGFPGIGHFLYKKNLAMPQSQNVLVATLFLGINIHFKNIYIVGADHTWHENLHVNEANQLCLKDVHFYDNENKVNYRLFYRDHQQQDTFRMDEVLHLFSKAFYGYQLIKKYAVLRQVSIYNASEVSFIDAFDRAPLPSLPTI